jgi:N-acetyl-alpha-D-glucosaminyl L-malate synthase BshA
MNPMKIGITCYPTYGGSGVVATEMGKELAHRGHEIHFISSSMPIKLNDLGERIHFHEVEMLDYPVFEHAPYALALATKMADVTLRYNLDLLHVHYAIPHSVSAYLAKQMLLPRHLPIITTLHGTDITLVGNDRSFLPITRFSIEKSDGVTAVSNFLRDLTYQEFEIRRSIEMIPNFVNCDQFVRRSNEELRSHFASHNEKILVHISNFRPVKRVTDVIDAFDMIRQKAASVLLMVGDGPERGNAEWRARQKKLGKDVFFLGKRETVTEILAISDLMLFPSENESFGLVALEAMACEVPVIAYRVGGLPEVIADTVDGYLVDPHDVQAMADRAIQLLGDESRLRTMGALARKNARKKYCANKIIPRYEEYYEEILQQVRGIHSEVV